MEATFAAQHAVRVDEALQVPRLYAFDPRSQRAQVVGGVQLAHHGGAHLVGDRARTQEVERLLHRREVERGDADGFGVTLWRVLHVHGRIIHKAFLNKRAQAAGEAAVRIQLHGEPQLVHASAELIDTGLQQRFTACDAHAVEQPLAFAEEREELVDR